MKRVSGEAEVFVDMALTPLPLAVVGLSCVNSSGKEQWFSLRYLQCFLARGVVLNLNFWGKINCNYRNY